MKWKEIVNDYLSFTRKERIGIFTVLLIIALAILFPIFFTSGDSSGNKPVDTSWITAMKNLEQKENESERHHRDDNEMNVQAYQYDRSKNHSFENYSKGELFYFDPNTLTADGWQKLGVRDRTIRIIQNYITKGGIFRKPEDLKRIYGLHVKDYERLAPFIKMNYDPPPRQHPEYGTGKTATENKSYTGKMFHFNVVEVNSADTTALISLPGIGSKLATRIIHFRDKLGGFYSIDQVRETFGLPDSTYGTIRQFLKIETGSIKKININTASIDELKNHPYIRQGLANAIISYRNEHGLFSTTDDIKKIMIITDEVHQKISPYLTAQ